MAERVTELLIRWSGGDVAALDALTPMLYGELKRVGRRLLARRGSNPVLQPTVLVHEAWLKLSTKNAISTTSRSHFLALAAKIMRDILVDHFRREKSIRRGGSRLQVTLDEGLAESAKAIDLLVLNDSLERLGAIKPRYVQIVELKFFAGLTIEECAAILNISHATVEREWNFTRSWLQRELTA